MDVLGQQDDKVEYKTSRRVQAWFLGRSRARWKRKYRELKVEAKKLVNQVLDVRKSRAKWREEARQLSQRVQELEAQNAALQKQVAAPKKDGPRSGSRVG